MNIKYFTLLFLTLISDNSYSFTCYFTLVKDSCWTNYDVKVVVTDTQTNQELLTIEVPKGKSWGRQIFTCEPSQRLIYHASYQPVFWRSEMGKTYMALRYWSLPAALSKDQSAWELPVCYPAAFSAIPLPPGANNNCHCDFKNIPSIKVK